MASTKLHGVDMRELTFVEAAKPSTTHVSAVQRGFPKQLRKLTKMVQLQAYGNLRPLVVPAWVGDLTSLQWLNISDSEVAKVPKEIGKLKHLRVLALDTNKLTEIPVEIGQLTELRALSMSRNRITALPVELGKLVNLTDLDVSRNKRLTELPDLSACKALDDVQLGHTGIAQLPLWLAKLPKLRRIWIEGSAITAVPDEFAACKKLEFISVDKKQLETKPSAALKKKLR